MDGRFLRIDASSSGDDLAIALFRGVKNAQALRKDIMASGSILASGKEVALLKAELVADPVQAAVAARKAALSKSRGRMTTRAWGSEVIFNVSGSKNITESLQKFGIGDADADLLVVILGSDERTEKEVSERIDGELVDLSELEAVTDWAKVKKAHKLNSVDENGVDLSMLKSLLISRAASKDISI